MPPKTTKKKLKEESENEDSEYYEEEENADEEVDEDVDDDVDDEEDEEVNENEECDIQDAIEDDITFFDDNNNMEIEHKSNIKYVTNENRISANRLTKYEMVRILGERTKQLTMGAKPLVKNYEDLTYDKIAEEEFMRNMIPFKIVRPLPNGMYELWTLDELSKDHLLLE
jgi:DNA-directed RNA polymerase subunit K/omega